MKICSICKKPIEPTWFGWKDGNNAWPVNEGRCCDECNSTVVIKARINLMRKEKAETRSK
jgi:DNA-directed RNA polymerase subunit RPC12/RpoP